MIKKNFFKWIKEEQERIIELADRKIAVCMDCAIDTLDYEQLIKFVKDAEDLKRLKKDFINHTPQEDDGNYLDYVWYFLDYGTRIEEF